jgi:hypothetical protein
MNIFRKVLAGVDWMEWAGRGAQLAFAVLAVCGYYGWAQQESRKQETLCDVAQAQAQVIEERAPRSAELKAAREAVRDACD